MDTYCICQHLLCAYKKILKTDYFKIKILLNLEKYI